MSSTIDSGQRVCYSWGVTCPFFVSYIVISNEVRGEIFFTKFLRRIYRLYKISLYRLK